VRALNLWLRSAANLSRGQRLRALLLVEAVFDVFGVAFGTLGTGSYSMWL